jgi:hypothetical protein
MDSGDPAERKGDSGTPRRGVQSRQTKLCAMRFALCFLPRQSRGTGVLCLRCRTQNHTELAAHERHERGGLDVCHYN